ncbi:MAG TPA: hypothetical protein VFU21_13540 [Kofleriaceae bacterium]|nr:hypothetical protein [Kofleriaceae bacterium]
MTAAVGADVESLCSKCGDVWHVVVAKVGEQIVKVQCKECGGYHRHRPPGGAAARKPRSSSAAASASPRRSALGSGAVAKPPPPSTFSPDPSLPVRTYSMRETFQPGEQIKHPRFGVGLVERSGDPGKISVLFSDGRKILAQAKPDSTLTPGGAASPMPSEDEAT